MNLDRFAQGLQDPQENEPEIFSSCDGCGEPILVGDSMLDYGCVLLHDDSTCTYNYTKRNASQTIAGEK